MVRRLDRLSRSLQPLIELVAQLAARRIGLSGLTEQIATTTLGGKLVFHVLRDFAEFERDLIRERTQVRLAAAQARADAGGDREAG